MVQLSTPTIDIPSTRSTGVYRLNVDTSWSNQLPSSERSEFQERRNNYSSNIEQLSRSVHTASSAAFHVHRTTLIKAQELCLLRGWLPFRNGARRWHWTWTESLFISFLSSTWRQLVIYQKLGHLQSKSATLNNFRLQLLVILCLLFVRQTN